MAITLSDKQQEIVRITDRNLLVLAGAGSGKTRILTERVRYLLEQQKGHFRVLALTFTNKAAEEMANRLKDINNLENKAFIGTMHRFCLEVVKSKLNLIGLREMPHLFEYEDDRKNIVAELFRDNINLKKYLDQKPDERAKEDLFQRGLQFISKKKRELVLPGDEAFAAMQEELQVLYKEYNDYMKTQGAIDFDDILVLAYRIFTENLAAASLYSRLYKFVCIDEAQDLNFAQYEIISTLCLNRDNIILMVGDPNQAIYGFNGADKKYMLESFRKNFNAHVEELKENYRSSRAVIRAANALIPSAIDEKNTVIKGHFELLSFETEMAEAEWITAKIKELLEKKNIEGIEGEIDLQKMAVLARNRYVFKFLEEELNKNHIHYFLKKVDNPTQSESDFIKIFDLGTRLLCNPLDVLHYKQMRKLLEITEETGEKEERGFAKLSSLKGKIQDTEWNYQYGALLEAWSILDKNESQFTNALDKLDHFIKSIDNDEYIEKKALIMEDIKELRELWRKFLQQSPTDNRTLQAFKTYVAMGITNTSKEKPGLPLCTIHAVKGLEYDIVFLMGMTQGTFPDYRAIKKGNAALEEEKNNAFVAVTRAKRQLYITYPKNKIMPWDKENPKPQKRSEFLENLETLKIKAD